MSALRYMGFAEKERYTKLLSDLSEAQRAVTQMVLDNRVDNDKIIYHLAQLEITIGIMCMKEDIDFKQLESVLQDSAELSALFKSGQDFQPIYPPRLSVVRNNPDIEKKEE